MTAFYGLWKKEWKMTRIYHIIVIALSILVMTLSYWGLADDGLVFVLIPVVILAGLHFFYLAGYLLFSFAREGRMLHAWLHNPQSIHQLALVKFLNGLLFMILSLSIVIGFMFWILSNVTELTNYMTEIGKFLVWANAHNVMLAIYFGMFLYFLWAIRHYLSNIIGGFSWLVTIVLFIGLPILLGWFSSTEVYAFLTHWGEIGFGLPTIQEEMNKFNVNQMETPFVQVYAGKYLFDFVTTILMYFIASYLLDRKVEV